MFLGIVERKDIGNIFSLGDIFVYASKSETQGMIISEAMYAGLPVVALDATGIKDFVENGVTGFLTKEKEEEFLVAVRKLLSDESLCEIFSLNCQKIAKKKYIASISAEKMLQIYQKAIAGKKVK
jgi:glycosyltransferase involved in cell wall biosynthesis